MEKTKKAKMINVIVSAEDLARTPELAEAGLEAGDLVGIEPEDLVEPNQATPVTRAIPVFYIRADEPDGIWMLIGAVDAAKKRHVHKPMDPDRLRRLQHTIREFDLWMEEQCH